MHKSEAQASSQESLQKKSYAEVEIKDLKGENLALLAKTSKTDKNLTNLSLSLSHARMVRKEDIREGKSEKLINDEHYTLICTDQLK